MVPLILISRPSDGEERYSRDSQNTISFDKKRFKFSAIYEDAIPEAGINKLTSSSCAIVLIGPTGSGKTTTLRKILEQKCGQGFAVTAYEVSENRAYVDLFDAAVKHKYMGSMPIETQLKKHELSNDILDYIFASRKSGATLSNNNSSRSCLIVNVYQGADVITIVDMMGSEKHETGPASVFANSNISSITQRLLSKTTNRRSSNLVTNLIFNRLANLNIKFVLHLDPLGDEQLIKSSLLNIATVLKDFKMGRPLELPSTLSVRKIPNYARPTAASRSPQRKLLRTRNEVPAAAKVTRVITSDPKSTISKLKQDNLELEQQKQAAESRIQGFVEDLSAMKNDLDESKQMLKTLQERETEKQDEIERALTKINELESAQVDLLDIVKLKTEQLDLKSVEAARVKQELEDLIANLQTLVSELKESLKIQQDKRVAAETKLQGLRKQHEAEVASAKSELEAKRAEHQKTILELEDAKQLYAKLEMANHLSDALQSRLKELENTISELRLEISQLQTSLAGSNTALETASAERREIAQKHADLVTYNHSVVEKYGKALQEKEESANMARNALKDRIDILETELVSQKNLNENLQIDLKRSSDKCKDYASTASGAKQELSAQVTLYEARIQSLQADIEMSRRKHLDLFSPSIFNPTTDIFDDSLPSLRHIPVSLSSPLKELNTLPKDIKNQRRTTTSFARAKSPKYRA